MRNNKKLNTAFFSAIALAGFVGSSAAQADFLGASIGASYWPASKSGQMQSGGTEVDLEKDLNFDKQDLASFFVAFEHPVPVLPNVKLQYVNMAETSQGTINTKFQNVTFSGDVTTDLDLTHYDLALYYEILDNWVSLDVGLNAKYFQGSVAVKQNNNASLNTKTDLNVAVPMLYASAAFELPFSDVSLIAEASGVGYSGNQLYDANLKVRKEIALFGVELGYRQLKLKLDDVKGINVDAKISGPFISAMLKF